MKNKGIYIVLAVLVVLALAFTIVEMTGQAISSVKGACNDTDNGDDKYLQGTAGYANRDKFTDACYGSGDANWLKEYLCLGDARLTSKRYHCDNGCANGACNK